jgi:hypothetical protein
MPEDYEVADRGFYGKRTTTDYGDIVEVQQSSSAEKDACWLRLRGDAHLDDDAEVIEHSPATMFHGELIPATRIVKASLSAHCTLEQAIEIRDMLNWWIERAEGRG